MLQEIALPALLLEADPIYPLVRGLRAAGALPSLHPHRFDPVIDGCLAEVGVPRDFKDATAPIPDQPNNLGLERSRELSTWSFHVQLLGRLGASGVRTGGQSFNGWPCDSLSARAALPRPLLAGPGWSWHPMIRGGEHRQLHRSSNDVQVLRSQEFTARIGS